MLFASMCLHVTLLLSWMLTPHLTGHPETVLSVSLNAPDRSAAAAVPRSANPAIRKSVPAHSDRTFASMQAVQPTRTPVSAAVVPSNSADGSGTTHAAARAHIQARLRADLQRYFEYPLLARLRGWEGTVSLSVTVDADGSINRIRVERSSGYAMLDNSATSAVHRIQRLTDASNWFNGGSLEVPLPVIYHLTEN